jgi:hypothetical protein
MTATELLVFASLIDMAEEMRDSHDGCLGPDRLYDPVINKAEIVLQEARQNAVLSAKWMPFG